MMIIFAIAIVWLDLRPVLAARKHFMDLYQASLKDKNTHVKAHAFKIAFIEAKCWDQKCPERGNVEANNALVMYNSNAPINIQGLKVSNFFKDPDGHISGGGVIGPNN